MNISSKKVKEYKTNAEVNRNTGKPYSGKFETRCKTSKVGKSIAKMNDEEIEMFYKIISSNRGVLRNALTNYFKVLGIRRDLSNHLCVDEAIRRDILKVVD